MKFGIKKVSCCKDCPQIDWDKYNNYNCFQNKSIKNMDTVFINLIHKDCPFNQEITIQDFIDLKCDNCTGNEKVINAEFKGNEILYSKEFKSIWVENNLSDWYCPNKYELEFLLNRIN